MSWLVIDKFLDEYMFLEEPIKSLCGNTWQTKSGEFGIELERGTISKIINKENVTYNDCPIRIK